MNEEYLARARERARLDGIDVRLFINGVSARAAQLAKGAKRLVPLPPNDEQSNLDIALLEVAEGKVVISRASEQAKPAR